MFGKVRQPKKRAFLAAVANTGNILRAAKLTGMDRDNHYLWMKRDPDYKEAFDIAWDMAVDALEAEAARRAFEGVLKPIYNGGKRAVDVQVDDEGKIVRDEQGNAVGVPAFIREYSDTLLIFFLKGNRGRKYRDNFSVDQRFVDQSGADRPLSTDLSQVRSAVNSALADQPEEARYALARKLLDMDRQNGNGSSG